MASEVKGEVRIHIQSSPPPHFTPAVAHAGRRPVAILSLIHNSQSFLVLCYALVVVARDKEVNAVLLEHVLHLRAVVRRLARTAVLLDDVRAQKRVVGVDHNPRHLVAVGLRLLQVLQNKLPGRRRRQEQRRLGQPRAQPNGRRRRGVRSKRQRTFHCSVFLSTVCSVEKEMKWTAP